MGSAMTSGRRFRRRSVGALLVLATGGCTEDALKLAPLTASLGGSAPPVTQSADPPVDVYARVARGALRCWFGPEGSLKKTHVFHAKVEPPADGGAAEISIQTRETGSTHGVLLAYAIAIAPAPSGSLIEARNFRFTDDQANLMTQDVSRWVSGKEDCSMVGTGGWAAGSSGAAPAPVAEQASGKVKPAQRP